MNVTRAKLLLLFALLLAPITAEAADARRLADLNPGRPGSYPSNLTAFASLYFSAYTLNTGFELFRFDGTNVSLVGDINPTKDDLGGVFEGNDSVPYGFKEYHGRLYFSAYEPMHGAELWSYDETNLLRISDINVDIAPDPTNAAPHSAFPRELTVFNDTLYFTATSSTNPLNYELWKYDTTNGVQLALELHPNEGLDHSSYPTGLRVFDGGLYFMADDGTNGWELFRHSAGETKLFDLNPGGTFSSSYPKYFTVFGSNLYFQAYTDAAGFELWRTDGTVAELVSDLYPGVESSYPEGMRVFGGALYFRATDPSAGSELWKFDGTNISLAADINVGGSSYPKNLTPFNGALILSADDGVHGWELWKFNGTNITMVADLNTQGDAFPENLTFNDGILYFTATTPQNGYELWKFDGTNVTLAADLNFGKDDSYPRFLTSLNRKLFFSAADDGRENWELWMFDPGFTNQRPMVTLNSPTDGAIFQSTESVLLSATATDEFEVIMVEFYAGEVPIGSVISAPWTISTNLPVGTNVISVFATDTSGAVTGAAPVQVLVVEAPSEPPSISSVSRAGSTTTITLETTSTGEFALEASSDLVTWVDVANGSAVEGVVTLTHESTDDQQFYRIRAL
jgi:ELWxxDGT repeat protein